MMDYTTTLLLLAALAACAFALVRGGMAERFIAGIICASIPFGFVFTAMPRDLRPVAELVGDGVIAFIVLGMALYFTSRWLGVVLLLYAAQFGLHAFYFVCGRAMDQIYLTANNLIFLAVSLALVVATAGAARNRAAQPAAG